MHQEREQLKKRLCKTLKWMILLIVIVALKIQVYYKLKSKH